MDLLGSILNSMDGPPAADEKRKEQMKSEFKPWSRSIGAKFDLFFFSKNFCFSFFF